MKIEGLSDQPLVSVIIPTYNRVDLLLQAIDSVQQQTYGNLEIIVVDDGSQDETSLLDNRRDLTFIRIPHSGRPGYVRNQGVKACSGELIAFLDSDDLWKRQKIEKQIQYLKDHPEISVCHTREVWLRNGREVSQSGQKHLRQGNIFQDCLKKCIIGPSTVILTTQLFEESGMFHPGLEIAEDYELWLRISSKHRIGYLDEALVIKRGGHGDQLSLKYGHIEIFRIQALLHDVEKGMFKNENLELAHLELSRKCRIYSAGCRKRGREEEANRYLEMARRFSPS
jgi:glycosyltransferase involved in cell wall biosynthesis